MDTSIKGGFEQAIEDIKNFFIDIYNTVFDFLAKHLGEDMALLAIIAIAFLIIMLVLTKVITKN